jgi:hypothetical protein
MTLRALLITTAVSILFLFPGIISAQPFADDLGIDSVVTPTNIQCVGSYPFVVCIKNHGTTAVTYAYVRYRVNNSSYTTTQFNGNLLPGDTMLYTVATIPMNNFGTYTIDILTSYVNTNTDPDHSNDTIHTVWTINNVVNVNAGADIFFCPGDSALISCNGPYTAYSWNSGQSTQSFYETNEGIYIITATGALGCTDKDTVELIEHNSTFHSAKPYGYTNPETSTAICDFNGDGFMDIYGTRNNNTGQYLMINDSTGNFDYNPTASFPTTAYAISWADMDNDGDEDMLIGTGGTRIYRNTNNTYTLQPNSIFNNQENSGTTAHVAWTDLDNDGQLDIVTVGSGLKFKHYTSSNGGQWINDTVMSIAPDFISIADLDNDGDQDFVTDNGNFLKEYINDGLGNFSNPANNGLQFATCGNATGGSWGDFDNDGDLDFLLGNSSSNTTRIFQNNMNGTFTALTNTGDLALNTETVISTSWGDYDSDGFLDIFMAIDPTTNLGDYFEVYHSNGDGTFSLIDNDTLEMNYTPQNVGWGMGFAIGDFENDGDIDVHIAAGTNLSGTIYRNDGSCNSWLNVQLQGTISNRSAIGARIYAYATINGTPQIITREIQSLTGHHSENDRRQHFGLGDAAMVDSLVIHWPSGLVETMYNVVPGQFMYIVEGVGPLGTESITTNTAYSLYPNPANDELNIVVNSLVADSKTIEIVALNGQLVMEPFQMQCSSGSNTLTINTSSLMAGCYFVRILDDTSMQTMRLIIAE